MKCPKCGFEFRFHRKLPELNSNQRRTIKFCKNKPRYMFEICRFLFGDAYYSKTPTTLSCIRSLLKRGLLFECEPDSVLSRYRVISRKGGF